MSIPRRRFLGIGAAVGLSVAAPSCRDTGSRAAPEVTPSPTVTPTPSPSPIRPGPTTLPGQPSPGSVYYGASVPHHRSLPAWERVLGSTLALNRSYFTPDANETTQLVARCRDDLAHHRLPHVSIKPAGRWGDVAAGDHDEWLSTMFRSLGDEASPMLFTLNHEPENDAGGAGMEPGDFVAMQHRAMRLAAELAPLVIVVPVLQHWTFDPFRDDIDPANWIPPETPAIGVDVYNPWSPTNGKQWRTFSSKLDDVMAWVGETPLVIGEYGCRDDPQNPGLAAEWLRDAAAYARTHNVFSMSYFNSGVDSPDGSWEMTGEMEAAFAELLSSDWVARPA